MSTTQHGGQRSGAGRKKKEPISVEVIIDELVFPAICAAYHAKRSDSKFAQEMHFHMSKKDIRLAYGQVGVDLFCSYFTEVRKGGISVDGTAYTTRWSLSMPQMMLAQRIAKELGADIKNLPKVFFPPQALLDRVAEIKMRRAALQAKKAARQQLEEHTA